jgi:ATP-dependent Clp protease ATP-binding subunit ClpC
MFERFTERARQVVVVAQEEARTLKHNYIGTERILLGLVRENEGVAERILLDFDADSEKIRNEVIRLVGAAPNGSFGSEGSVSDPAPSPFGDQPLATPADVELGWRRRPIALAALGAAVPTRMTFDRSKTGHLEPLELQVLARLTLGPPDAALTEPGELFESLVGALACRRLLRSADGLGMTQPPTTPLDDRRRGHQPPRLRRRHERLTPPQHVTASNGTEAWVARRRR